jgi:hypothetical protein
MTSAQIFIGLFLASVAYAFILNRKAVYRWYHRGKTWVTVVVGNGIILAALYLHVEIGTLTMAAWWLVFWSNIAAGAPIIAWQLGKNAEQEEIERQIEQEEEKRRRGA